MNQQDHKRAEYTKPHTTYGEQVEKLTTRGLACPDESALIELLESIGYYRLGAYIYPFRELHPADERRSSRNFRSDTIRPGTTFDMVRDLWRFDRNLRLVLLDAVEAIEVGLKSRMAYVLGARDTFGHLNSKSLDTHHAGRLVSGSKTAHQVWVEKYNYEIKRSQEDYVVHNRYLYHRLPVWIGLEPLSFGQVTDLLRMMTKEDQDEVAQVLGVGGGKVLGDWLTAIRRLRNEAAHHSRVWNRERSYKIAKPRDDMVGPDLLHLRELDPSTQKKIYATLAVSGYLVRQLDPKSKFFGTFRTRMKQFPNSIGMSPENDMGFPDSWQALPLWKIG